MATAKKYRFTRMQKRYGDDLYSWAVDVKRNGQWVEKVNGCGRGEAQSYRDRFEREEAEKGKSQPIFPPSGPHGERPPPSDKAKRIVRELMGWLQAAVGDMAGEMTSSDVLGFNGDEWDDRIKKAKKEGVRDLTGWLADELYNDVPTLTDLLGDRIAEETANDLGLREEVLRVLGEQSPRFKKVAQELGK